MSFSRMIAALAALATALVLSACSASPDAGDGHAGHTSVEQTPAISGEPAGFDADDIAFATAMIPHHQQAVDLAALVPGRTTNADVTALAQRISAAQEPEITTMKAFLVQWKENPGDGTEQGGHGGHEAMTGMVDDATMEKLKASSGSEFDTLWLKSMIGHHQGAIEMARAELANGQNVDAKSLAQNIIDTQQAEIEQMQTMLGTKP